MTGHHLRPDLSLAAERYITGDMWRTGEFQIRVAEGRKAPGDQRVDVRCDGWHAITFDDIARIVDILYENEHRLFPPRFGYDGGDKLMRHLRDAIKYGPDKAATTLRLEKMQSDARGNRLFDDGAA